MSKRKQVRFAVAETSHDLQQTWSVVKAGLRGLTRSRIPQMAAALSFRTLFALIPVLVLSLVVLQAFVGKDEVTQVLRKTLEFTGISQLVLSDTDAPNGAQPEVSGSDARQEETPIEGGEEYPAEKLAGDPTPAERAQAEIPDQLQGLQTDSDNPDAREVMETARQSQVDNDLRLDQWISSTVERILAIRFQTIGALGVLAALIYAAISMLVEVERTFNQIYRAQAGRSWVRRVPQYWTLLTLSVLVLVGTFYAGERFQSMAGDFLGGAIGFIVQASITALLLTFAYTVMPNTKVAVRAAAAGALVAALAWEVAKTGFRAYIEFAVSYRTLYGSIALPLFAMLWMYLTWIFILFGLQVSYGIQHISTWKETQESEDEPMLNDPASAVPLVVAIAERFDRGDPASHSYLSSQTGMPEPVIDELLLRLSEDKLVHRVDGKEEAFSLSRPPDRILASEVLESAQRATGLHTGDDRTIRWFETVQKARSDASGDQTIRDLMDGNASEPEAGSEPSPGPVPA